MAHQDLGWPLPSTETTSVGPFHAPRFEATSTLQIADRSLQVFFAERTKKAAVQGAAVGLVARLLGLEGSSQEEGGDGAPETSDEEAADPNAKGLLLELCASRAWPAPAFSVSQEGPSHAPLFTAVVTLSAEGQAWTSGPTSGTTRKKAEHAAARALLAALAPLSAPRPRGSKREANPIGWLQERCASRHLPPPAYEHATDGPLHEATCEVALDDGTVLRASRRAGRIADARRAAADAVGEEWSRREP
jgi:hypothetical protein